MNEVHCPDGWAVVSLGDVALWGSGGTPSRKNSEYYGGDIPWVKTGDLGPKLLTSASEFITEAAVQNSSAKYFPKGSVAIAMYGATIGKTSILGIEATTNQACAVGQPIDGCTSTEFLYYLLRNEKDNFIAKGKGGAQPNISQALIKEHKVLFPPLAEQKQIAAKLDELLAQVDTIKTRLDAIPSILKRFRQSVLAAAVSGRLTEEWRGLNSDVESGEHVLEKWLRERRSRFDSEQALLIQEGKQNRAKKYREPTVPDLETRDVKFPARWATVSVSQFAECLDHLRVPVTKADRFSAQGLYPYFGANGEVDRVDQYLFDDDLVLVTEDETFYGRTKPIAYRFTGKCWVNNHAHVLRAPTKDANDYICYALMYYDVIPWLSGTTGRAKLTQGALNSLPLGLPSEEEQSEIVQRVDELLTYADQVEQRVKDAQTRVNNLTQSVLAKAFRGGLTAEWREQNPDLISGENSTQALLERIKTEQVNLKPKKKGRKKNAA